MNMRQAREEAKKKFGALAFVQSSRYHFAKDGVTPMKGIGKWVMTGKNTSCKEYYGWGETWEQAFEQANNRLHLTGGGLPATQSSFTAEVIPPAKLPAKSPRR